MQQVPPTLANFIRLGFGDVQDPPLPVSVPEFLTGPLVDWLDIAMCLHAVGAHGRFDPGKVARELKPLVPELMDVRIGRQESVVVVASIPFWTSQEIRWAGGENYGIRLRRRDRDALAERVGMAFERASGECGSLIDDDLLDDGAAVVEVSGHWDVTSR